ncbi:hypothetical protein RI129_007759 [Pyrocoelia pectoralis]|uniref:Uncharacterized protein n=1 Tax=Pyrocoelia pectoralis TaxID=417401 RepID=A0AAN7VCY4_9COLE
MLLEFISWLIDDDTAISRNIIMAQFDKIYKKNFYQFGLGLYVYHLVRSRQLLDLLSEIGISCTCNDIRQLTTKISKQRIVYLTQFMYLPPGVQVVDNKIKNYIHASIENFDLNEDTIDGKNTTHCMGMVLTWSGFNKMISENVVSVNDIFYMAFVNNRSTELYTIYTSMARLVELVSELNQSYIVITANYCL